MYSSLPSGDHLPSMSRRARSTPATVSHDGSVGLSEWPVQMRAQPGASSASSSWTQRPSSKAGTRRRSKRARQKIAHSVGEIGELAVAGEYVMAGYWRNPEATAAAVQDGWFRTGDLARVDEDDEAVRLARAALAAALKKRDQAELIRRVS